jgi:hypothetical protein
MFFVDERSRFVDPWWDIRGDEDDDREQRDGLAQELYKEVGPGHLLYGQRVEVIAQSDANDDIAVRLASGGFARVHLTWRGSVEPPQWPATTLYDTLEALHQAIEDDVDEDD